jgi:hypothetical protein
MFPLSLCKIPRATSNWASELVSGSVTAYMNCQMEQNHVTAEVFSETEDEIVYSHEIAVKINTFNA